MTGPSSEEARHREVITCVQSSRGKENGLTIEEEKRVRRVTGDS
jgi:hypothetical protein